MPIASTLLQQRRFAVPRNPAFTLPEYPKLNPNELPTKAQHGVLGQLDGTWVNAPGVYGLHTTILPAPGSTSEQMFGTYHFKTDEYTETLTFEKNPNPVRNRLGSNETFNGALTYDSNIVARSGEKLHFETGHYLWLGVWGHDGAAPYSDPPMLFSRETTAEEVESDFLFPVLAEGSRGPQFVPPYSISRQGRVPHGNAIHLFGNPMKCNPPQPVDPISGLPAQAVTGAPVFPALWHIDSLAFNNTMIGTNAKIKSIFKNLARVKPDFASYPIYHGTEPTAPQGMLSPNSGEAYVQRIFNGAQLVDKKLMELFPYCVQPNLKLSDANEGLDIVSHDSFTLNTKQDRGLQGGSLNNVGVERYAKVVDMQVTMWISKVKDKATGRTFDQLQYEQRVNFEFQFGTGGSVTKWPHIQVNTLRRKEDVDGGSSQKE